jgi:hypothetical protein
MYCCDRRFPVEAVEWFCRGSLDDRNERKTLHLYFPRDISQLRSAYQRAAGGYRIGKANVPRTTLPLDLDSNSTDEDTVREYSGKQLPLSQEAVMLGIVGELQAHQTKIVLLRATSALDQLFLSRYLRQAYSDARIITVSADLLFARELEDARLHGVMALTTYSLTPAADHEFHNDAQIHSDRVFPNTHAVGTYNAVKLLMEKGQLGQGECTSRAADRECLHLFQYEWPMLSRGTNPLIRVLHPPVHLTVLGHGGFWEMAVLPERAEDAANQSEADRVKKAEYVQGEVAFSSLPSVDDPRDRPRPNAPGQQKANDTPQGDKPLEEEQPQIWYVLWIVAVGVSLAYAYFIWFPSVLSSSQSVAQLAPSMPDSRGTLLALTALLHFSLLLAVFWPYWYLFKNGTRGLEIAGLLVAMAAVAVSGAADLRRRSSIMHTKLLLGSFVLMLLVLWIAWKPDYFHYMSVFRSVHLASGLSELLSVLLLLSAGLWGAWYSLSGTSLLDARRTILPSLRIDSLQLSESQHDLVQRRRSILEEGQHELRNLLNATHVDKRALLLTMFENDRLRR